MKCGGIPPGNKYLHAYTEYYQEKGQANTYEGKVEWPARYSAVKITEIQSFIGNA